jgi:hypothetical protein
MASEFGTKAAGSARSFAVDRFQEERGAGAVRAAIDDLRPAGTDGLAEGRIERPAFRDLAGARPWVAATPPATGRANAGTFAAGAAAGATPMVWARADWRQGPSAETSREATSREAMIFFMGLTSGLFI